MKKENLITLFKIGNILLGLFVSAVSLIGYLVVDDMIFSGMFVGMGIGVWIGIAINHFIQIPKLYENKDERQLIITIISTGSGVSFACIVTFILFSLTALTNFHISYTEYMYILFGIVVSTFGIRFVSYKVLDMML